MMTSYELTKDAENDLRDIARYTLKEWGKEAFERYRSGIKKTFQDIGKNKILKRQFSERFPELLVTKYRRYYIFYLTEKVKKPVIIGVIHERRDIVSRLSERLS